MNERAASVLTHWETARLGLLIRSDGASELLLPSVSSNGSVNWYDVKSAVCSSAALPLKYEYMAAVSGLILIP